MDPQPLVDPQAHPPSVRPGDGHSVRHRRPTAQGLATSRILSRGSPATFANARISCSRSTRVHRKRTGSGSCVARAEAAHRGSLQLCGLHPRHHRHRRLLEPHPVMASAPWLRNSPSQRPLSTFFTNCREKPRYRRSWDLPVRQLDKRWAHHGSNENGRRSGRANRPCPTGRPSRWSACHA